MLSGDSNCISLSLAECLKLITSIIQTSTRMNSTSTGILGSYSVQPTKMIDSIYLQIIAVLFALSYKCDILKIL